MDTSIQRLSKMKKNILCITAHTTIEKQSNKDWNTPIHLKNNGPSKNVINVSLMVSHHDFQLVFLLAIVG